MIEIQKEVKVCEVGKMVGNSEAVLLAKLNIKPFYYGMEVIGCYDDGALLDKDMVGITPEDILSRFKSGVKNVAALSLETGLVTEASIPHLISNAFKNLAAISMETDYKLKELENMSTGPVQQTTETKVETKVEAKVIPKKRDYLIN
jgi:large subunit ribosomal protein LP0